MNHPPYHLRINKAVDRMLLVNVMREILPPHKKCAYYSLAGPFLEDLRVINHAFPRMRLESIESSPETVRRQRFHKFRRDIVLNSVTDDRFVSDYDAEERKDELAVFWLDYTKLNYPQLVTFGETLKKVPVGSIVRITLRAEPDKSIAQIKQYLTEEKLAEILSLKNQDFRDRFVEYLSPGHEDICVNESTFARTVQLMVRNAASKALDTPGSTRDFLHIHSVRYNDDTQMLSVTGVVYMRNRIGTQVLEDVSKDSFVRRLRDVPLVDFGWESEPHFINIPALTMKERLKLEEHLPLRYKKRGKTLARKLGYRIAADSRNLEQLLQYAEYHREYPNFIRAAF